MMDKNLSKISGHQSKIRFSIFDFRFSKKGFTLAELIVSATILGILIITASAIYTNFYNSVNNIRAANLIYDEARFTMERVAKEIRNGTIDFEEYYNQSVNFKGDPTLSVDDTYGQNYCQYSRQFYGPGPDGKYGTYDDESLGGRKPGSPNPLSSPIQDNLYLINSAGDKRTYIKLMKTPEGLGKVGILKLSGFDYGIDHVSSELAGSACKRDSGERDGLIDTWKCDPGFNCEKKWRPFPCNSTLGYYNTISDDPNNPANSDFIDITPSTLDIVNLKFFITPTDDPYKAYNNPGVQIQPYVTIKMYARANSKIVHQATGGAPDIVLETTVSARVYNEIITSCNLQECIDGDKRDCPKKPCAETGVCVTPQATCAQGVWPICTDLDYEFQAGENAKAAFGGSGLDNNPPFDTLPSTNLFGKTFNGSFTYYEANNEVGSCDTLFTDENDIILCKHERCTDNFDNDGNGLSDEDDPACVWVLCNNGVFDPPVEACIDVGGNCSWRPKKQEESGNVDCFDKHDNDCNSLADQFNPKCAEFICSNGDIDPPSGYSFLRSNYTPKNYLAGALSSDIDISMNEKCIDIGGLCSNVKQTDTLIDGVTITRTFETKIVPGFTLPTEWGSCTDLFAGKPNAADDIKRCKELKCSDGLDNNCDGKADELDPSCKPAICSNGRQDLGLVNSTGYPTPNYLVGFNDTDAATEAAARAALGLPPLSDLNEACVDIGGLCGNLSGNENTFALCSNNVDDNCNGKTDQQDPGCCPDADNDTSSPINSDAGGLMCNPAPGGPAPAYSPPGTIDCNDKSADIKPQIIETTCDDAKYPIGYDLLNGTTNLDDKPVDENCSGANKIEANGFTQDAWDHNDPTCCVDLDKDGYGACDDKGDGTGIPRAIYNNSNGDCRHSADFSDPNSYIKNIGNLQKCDCNDDHDTGANTNPGATEKCDGIDNNCDGITDEGFNVGTVCNVGVGECRTTGFIICKPDGTAGCSVSAGTPSPEICDAKDNNCDGAIDDGFNIGTACSVGVGACQRDGLLVCKADKSNSECNILPGPPGANDICGDSIDNNCNGSVDEGC